MGRVTVVGPQECFWLHVGATLDSNCLMVYNLYNQFVKITAVSCGESYLSSRNKDKVLLI